MKIIDVTGKRFGRLTITECVKGSFVLATCDCGSIKRYVKDNVTSGKTMSCGCLFLEKVSTHKSSRTPLYFVWSNMKQRCYNINNTRYSTYGGRGIGVCCEWVEDFPAFKEWAESNGWEKGLHIDRIDNDGNYEPSNCQFITNAENNAVGKQSKQASNTSGFTGVYYDKTRDKWSARIEHNKRVASKRCKNKEDAISTRARWEEEIRNGTFC